MSDLKVCRVCLCTDVKMYKYDLFQLRYYYEDIMAEKIKETEGLPHYFCYECASLLHKFHKFKEKCLNGQYAFKEILWKGAVITWKSIAKVDRQKNKLQSSIGIINVNERVKTYEIKHSSSSYKTKIVVETDIIDPEEVNFGSDSDVESIKADNHFDNNDDFVDENETIDDKKVTIELEKIQEHIKTEIEHTDVNDAETEINESRENDIKTILVDLEVPNIKNDLSKDTKVKDEKCVIKRKDKSTTKIIRTSKKKKGKQVIVEAVKFQSAVKKKQDLNSSNWQTYNLPEEEALKEFQARAQNPKYINAIYKCTGCLKGFSKEDMMKRHIKLRHSESNGSVECRFCHIRFKWKSLLSRHVREHYNKYKCLRCDLTFSRETSAHHHDQFHNGVTRTCEYCNEKFTHLSTYYTHLRKHRSKHLCAFCGESFVSEFGLQMHRRVKHIMDTENQDTVAAETLYCERCDIKFETNKAYEEHLIHSAMHSASEETPTLMNLKGGTVIRRAPRKQTQCTICNKNFSTLVAYNKHHQTEHPDVPLSVSSSGKASSAAGNVAQGQERHICEICGALLAPNSIYSHVNTHTRERQYTCTTCGMQFNARGTLQRHYLTHTGEKPVECALCDKRFTQVASMRLHYRTIHLKQPYPKRVRRKKAGDPEETALIAEYYQNKETAEEMTMERWRPLRL